jgi:hypothetical protein
MDLKCNSCGSDNTQKLSAIVSRGTTHGYASTTASSVGVVNGALATSSTVASTHTTSSTDLAQKLTWPQKLSERWLLKSLILGGGAGFICFQISMGIGFWIRSKSDILAYLSLIIGHGFGAYLFIRTLWKNRAAAKRNAIYNKEEYPHKIARWQKSFYCHRCENVFIPRQS